VLIAWLLIVFNSITYDLPTFYLSPDQKHPNQQQNESLALLLYKVLALCTPIYTQDIHYFWLHIEFSTY
jgi:hypothetical protein